MNFLLEIWMIFASTILGWFSALDNNILNNIASLLTILALSIGITDWCIRKIKGKGKEKPREKTQEKRQVLDLIEGTQKPFRAVNMLDNPMESGEKLGNLVDSVSKTIGGKKMKKFFKWLWYNKEQLLSILYNAVIVVLSQVVIWSDLVYALYPDISSTAAIVTKISIGVVSALFTALNIRNVCVKHGLSSLDTIDAYLAQKAEEAASKLTPEQKKALKTAITTLQDNVNKALTEKTTATKTLAELTALFNADNALVPDYGARKASLERVIQTAVATITSLEPKIVEYKARLSGKTVNK